LITGVSKGLGRAFAEKFRAEGFAVAGVSRSKPNFEIELWLEGDITDPGFRRSLPSALKLQFARLDVLINNAGIGGYETWEQAKEEDVRKLFELNFFAPILLTQELIPLLRENKGTIINVSSVAGRLAVPCMGAYCASKFAIDAFSDSLRVELKPENIHVLNLTVGRINTGFSSRSFGAKKPPGSPGGNSSSPEGLAAKTYRAYTRKHRNITYPAWYAPGIVLMKLFRGIYERENIRRWKLGAGSGP